LGKEIKIGNQFYSEEYIKKLLDLNSRLLKFSAGVDYDYIAIKTRYYNREVDDVIRTLIDSKFIFYITIPACGGYFSEETPYIIVQPFKLCGCGGFIGLAVDEFETNISLFSTVHFDSRSVLQTVDELLELYEEYNF